MLVKTVITIIKKNNVCQSKKCATELLANAYIKGASDLLQGKIEGMPKIVVIPDNATNGDMVMAILNPYKICEYKYSVHVYMTEKKFLEC